MAFEMGGSPGVWAAIGAAVLLLASSSLSSGAAQVTGSDDALSVEFLDVAVDAVPWAEVSSFDGAVLSIDLEPTNDQSSIVFTARLTNQGNEPQEVRLFLSIPWSSFWEFDAGPWLLGAGESVVIEQMFGIVYSWGDHHVALIAVSESGDVAADQFQVKYLQSRDAAWNAGASIVVVLVTLAVFTRRARVT